MTRRRYHQIRSQCFRMDLKHNILYLNVPLVYNKINIKLKFWLFKSKFTLDVLKSSVWSYITICILGTFSLLALSVPGGDKSRKPFQTHTIINVIPAFVIAMVWYHFLRTFSHQISHYIGSECLVPDMIFSIPWLNCSLKIKKWLRKWGYNFLMENWPIMRFGKYESLKFIFCYLPAIYMFGVILNINWNYITFL